MSIFSKIKHGFEDLGHDIGKAAKDVGKGLETAGKDIEKVGKGIGEGVEMVGKTLAKDALATAQATLESADALIHGHLQQALNKATEAGEDLVKTSVDVSSAGAQATVNSLANMHLSKKMDNAMGKAEKGFNSFKNTVVKSTDQVVDGVVKDTEGAVKGTVEATKDAVHGKWGAAAGALGNATMDALNVAADLTPEGAAASVGTQLLINAHVGNEQIDSAIGGALHGNVAQMAKGVVKNVSETEISNKAQEKFSEVASKVMPQGGGSGENDALVAAGLGFAGAAAGDGLGSKRSRGEAGGGSSHSFSFSGRSSKDADHAGETRETESKEAKDSKKENAEKNAQTAANNTAGNAVNNAPGNAGADNSQFEQELMLQTFLMQAGMSPHSDAEKRRAELTSDS